MMKQNWDYQRVFDYMSWLFTTLSISFSLQRAEIISKQNHPLQTVSRVSYKSYHIVLAVSGESFCEYWWPLPDATLHWKHEREIKWKQLSNIMNTETEILIQI